MWRQGHVGRLMLGGVDQQMTGTTICLLADSCAMPIRAFVTNFRDEFEYLCKEHKPKVEDALVL